MTPLTATVVVPDRWRDAASSSQTVDARWWSAFGDPVLTQLIDDALAHNDDIALAAERVAQARAQFRLAQSQRLPDIVGGAEGGRDRDINPGFGFPEEQTFGAASAQASWDLDLFDRLRNASGAASATLLSSQAARYAVRLSVSASTAHGYINLRALDAQLAVLRKTLDTRAQALRLVERRANAGYSPTLELRQAQAEYHAAEQLIPVTELAIRKQEDGLSILIGRAPAPIIRGETLESLSPPAVSAGLPSALLRHRPDVAAAEDQVVAAEHSLDSVRAAFMPDLQLSAQAGAVMSTLIERNPTQIYTLEGGVLGPIFDSGRLRAEQSGAAARRDEAAFNYRKAVLTAFRETEDALATVQHAREQEMALDQEQQALAAAYRQASGRYRAGYSPYLETVDAERTLLAVQLAEVQSQADRLNAAVSLFEALGGGWSADAQGPARAKPN